MKTKYRISFGETRVKDLLVIIKQYGIKFKRVALPGSTSALISFDVFDDHIAWGKVMDLVTRYNIPFLITNVFSEKEIRAAKWCRVMLVNHVGYPQPEDEWLSTRFTYADYDRESGTHSYQVEDFRIKHEPGLRNKHFLDLTWPHEIFARKEVIEKLEEASITGYSVRDVLIDSTGEPSKEISQIVIPKITGADAIIRSQIASRTNSKEKKYLPHTKGMLLFTRELLAESVDFVQSKEWFGDKHAFREKLISKKVANLVLDNHWKGISLEPVQIEA